MKIFFCEHPWSRCTANFRDRQSRKTSRGPRHGLFTKKISFQSRFPLVELSESLELH